MAMAALARTLDSPWSFRLLRQAASISDLSRWNLASSPVSLHTALSLVLSATEGTTAGNSRERAHILFYLRSHILFYLRSHSLPGLPNTAASSLAADSGEEDDHSANVIAFHTSAWIDESLLTPSFSKLGQLFGNRTMAEETRERESQRVDLHYVRQVRKPRETLPFETVGADTRILICIALYFKGHWAEKFYVSENRSSKFYRLDGSSLEGPFMTSNAQMCVESYDGFKVLRLPFKKGKVVRQFAMYIFLPDARDGLWELEEKMSSDLGFVDRHIPKRAVVIRDLKVPVGSKGTIVAEGLGLVWPPPMEMETVDPEIPVLTFSSPYFCVCPSDEVKGSEGVGSDQCKMGGNIDFVADHPFVSVIREDISGIVLVTGHMLDPSIGSALWRVSFSMSSRRARGV